MARLNIETSRRRRKPVSKKIRFEVFKRDSFTCQYCGDGAPNTVLNVDHINPVANGGGNDLLNLVTSCFGCNSGKRDRLISDNSILKTQMSQAKVLSEKREQLKMLAEWNQSLKNLSDQEVDVFSEYLKKNYEIELSNIGRNEFKKILKKYGLSDVLAATEKSEASYLDDKSSEEQCNKFLDYIPRICYWQKRERENPVEAELRKIAFTAKKRWWKCNPQQLTRRLFELHFQDGVPLNKLLGVVVSSTGIMQFDDQINSLFSAGN